MNKPDLSVGPYLNADPPSDLTAFNDQMIDDDEVMDAEMEEQS